MTTSSALQQTRTESSSSLVPAFSLSFLVERSHEHDEHSESPVRPGASSEKAIFALGWVKRIGWAGHDRIAAANFVARRLPPHTFVMIVGAETTMFERR
jgi:hypothetical protein